jgi:hypothetical protein
MRPVMRLVGAAVTLSAGVGLAVANLEAAPAAPTYVGVERSIEAIRQEWSRPGARVELNAARWNALFDALLEGLRSYATAEKDTERLAALERVDQISAALDTVSWARAENLQQEIRQWLRPRLRLAWARRNLSESVTALPASTDPAVQANRSHWVAFVENDLGRALRDYDTADTVLKRQTALRRIDQSLNALDQQNQNQGLHWPPSSELSAAVNDLFNQPNLNIAADLPTVAPVFETNLVVSGPVTRKGYTSQVTAGPKTGFGLLESDDGIAFYNSQALTSVTPIWDFQNQIASDRRGRTVAKIYEFGATTYDCEQLTVTTILKPSGLESIPSASHDIDAAITSAPAPCGGHTGRTVAAAIGFNQQKITDKVYEGAIGQFRQRIPAEAAEETQERMDAELAQRNADLRSKYLIGNDTAAFQDLLLTQLSLRSRPDAVFVTGLFRWRGAPDQRGADTPRPAKLATIEQGVTADLHLGSLLTSAGSGLWQRDEVKSVQNVMIVTRAVPPGTPPRDAVAITSNADFPTYLKAVDAARKARHPQVTALRVRRPQLPPEFSSDARGFLVALIKDLQLQIPAPEGPTGGQVLGVPARVLQIRMPQVEAAVSYQIDTSSPDALRLRGKIEEFTPGPGAEVVAITDNENKGTPLTRFTVAFVMGALGARVRGQTIDVSLDQRKLPGWAIRSVSPLDPSGWMRINLVRTAGAATPAPAPTDGSSTAVQPR